MIPQGGKSSSFQELFLLYPKGQSGNCTNSATYPKKSWGIIRAANTSAQGTHSWQSHTIGLCVVRKVHRGIKLHLWIIFLLLQGSVWNCKNVIAQIYTHGITAMFTVTELRIRWLAMFRQSNLRIYIYMADVTRCSVGLCIHFCSINSMTFYVNLLMYTDFIGSPLKPNIESNMADVWMLLQNLFCDSGQWFVHCNVQGRAGELRVHAALTDHLTAASRTQFRWIATIWDSYSRCSKTLLPLWTTTLTKTSPHSDRHTYTQLKILH